MVKVECDYFYKTPVLTRVFRHFCLKMPVFIDVSIFYRRISASIGGKTPPLKHLCLTAFLCAFLTAEAQIQTPEADLPPQALAQRLKKLESELRCLVCQNQTLAESPAGLAGDLRREVRLLIDQGKTDDEIKSFLQARYGDFVLYKPPVDPKTYLLWFGPFGLLGGGAGLVWWMTRRRRMLPHAAEASSKIDQAAQQRARQLLDAEEEKK